MNKDIQPFSLQPDIIHVWVFSLVEPDFEYPMWVQSLSEEERDRSKQYKFEIDRLRFVARRGLLRQLLAKYCGTAPGEIVYKTNQFGKLSLPSKSICFNLSASQNKIAIAFTPQNEVGVDIEKVHSLPELSCIAETRFSSVESARLFTLAPEKQLDGFYHVWTQKEAFVKARGEGLSLPLDNFSVEVDPDVPGGIQTIKGGVEEVSAWKMYTKVSEPGWRLAVCVQAEFEQDVHLYMPASVDFI